MDALVAAVVVWLLSFGVEQCKTERRRRGHFFLPVSAQQVRTVDTTMDTSNGQCHIRITIISIDTATGALFWRKRELTAEQNE